MHEKKKAMIETGIRLFAQKGYHATSIQEIVDQSGVSKGAFYLHFDSKEDFTLAIHKFYYEQIMDEVTAVQAENLSPKESLAKQIDVFLVSLKDKKDFILMILRDNVSLGMEVDDFVHQMKQNSYLWAEQNLKNIYGAEIEEYLLDGAIMLEGLVQSYFKWMVMDNLEVDVHKLSSFIVKRLDDAIMGMLREKEGPIMSPQIVQQIFQKNHQAKLRETLLSMDRKIDDLNVTNKQDLHAAVEVMINETKNKVPKPVIFQGMLMHFKDIEDLTKEIQEIKELIQHS